MSTTQGISPISQISRTGKTDFPTLRNAMPPGTDFDAMLDATPGLKTLLGKLEKQGLIAGPKDGQAFKLEFNYWGHSPYTLHDAGEEKTFRNHIIFVWQKVSGAGAIDFGGGDTEAGAKLISVMRVGDLEKAGVLKLRQVGGLSDAACKDGIQFRADFSAFGKPGSTVTVGFANGLMKADGTFDALGRGFGYEREHDVKAGPGAFYPIFGHGEERFDDKGQLYTHK